MVKDDKRLKDEISKAIINSQDSVFNTLTPEQQIILRDDITCSCYEKGEYMFREDEKPTGLVCLFEGKVKVFKKGSGEKKQIIVRMVKPMGFVGYRALFAEESITSSAVAIESSITFTVSYGLVLKLIKDNHEFSIAIIRSFATELGFSNNRTITLTQKHMRGRLAESLLFFRDIYGIERDGVTIKALLSREEVANFSNMTTANAIRNLSAFSKEKIISVRKQRIKVLDETRLSHISKYE